MQNNAFQNLWKQLESLGRLYDDELNFTPEAGILMQADDRRAHTRDCPAGEQLFQYGKSTLRGQNEERSIDQHLASCKECRNRVTCVRDHGLKFTDFLAEGLDPCPDLSVLIVHQAGQLSEAKAQRLRKHILWCDECAEESVVLGRLRNESLAATGSG